MALNILKGQVYAPKAIDKPEVEDMVIVTQDINAANECGVKKYGDLCEDVKPIKIHADVIEGGFYQVDLATNKKDR